MAMTARVSRQSQIIKHRSGFAHQPNEFIHETNRTIAAAFGQNKDREPPQTTHILRPVLGMNVAVVFIPFLRVVQRPVANFNRPIVAMQLSQSFGISPIRIKTRVR